MGEKAVVVFRGTLVHSTADQPLQILHDRVVGLKEGKIVFNEDASLLEELQKKYTVSEIKQLKDRSQFLIPGFIDTHIHASQYPNAGAALGLGLLEWLNKYTFPVEANFADANFAKHAYSKAVQNTLRNGTTTAVYFATIHLDASLTLCDVIEENGQRAFVGKLQMDRQSPEFYIEESQASIVDHERFVKAVLQRNNPLVKPIVTPRFAATSSEECLKALGDLAKKYDLPIQSHISETRPEVDFIKELFPDYKNYSDVYDKNGLFTEKTIMAHGVYLGDEELDLIRERGVGISHCPNSNLSLRSGMLDVRRLEKKGVKIGLGTDVSGGYHPSMLNAIRFAEQVSNVLCIERYGQTPAYKPITFREAFKLATLGNAQLIGMEKQLGNFEVGKYFDALLIDTSVEQSPFDVFQRDKIDDIVEKFFHLGDDRNIQEVYVAGKKVHSRS